MKERTLFVAMALLAAATSTFAQNQMLDAIKGKLNESKATAGTPGSETASGSAAAGLASSLGLSMPQIGTSSAGNAAGVLQYCIKNNYLSPDAAGGVKDKLMGMVTGQPPQQTGYDNGALGMLQGSDGKSLSLDKVSGQIKTKACDYVLSNAKSLI